jgi:hemicentin
VELFCIYHGSPTPKITWSKKGKPIEFNERLVLENFGRSLKIKKAGIEDDGEYTCNASSENGENQSSNFKLKIESPPQFTAEPESKNVTLNEIIELICEADGLPEPKIEWIFNGELLESSTRGEMSENKFIIKEAAKGDTGNYACRAVNIHGIAFKNIYINVDSL